MINMKETVQLKIWRQRPQGETPGLETFTLNIDTDMSVLDAFEVIRSEQDATLMYRHSCHHSSCGTCAMKINGIQRLACVTRISQLETRPINVEPLSDFPVIADLVVDMAPFYQDIDEDWAYLKTAEDPGHQNLPEGISRFERFENCIECGCCVSACPVTGEGKPFMGPAALAAINAALQKTTGDEKELLEKAGSDRGERLCDRALACSRVCPTAVYPARHILDLRKRLRDHGRKE